MPRYPREFKDFYKVEHRGFISPCWIWVGTVNKRTGYGQYMMPRTKCNNAHRYSYVLHRGNVANGLELDHLCRIRACVNPDHLKAVLPKDNRPNSNWGWRRA